MASEAWFRILVIVRIKKNYSFLSIIGQAQGKNEGFVFELRLCAILDQAQY